MDALFWQCPTLDEKGISTFDPNDIIMEYPHNRIKNAQVDTYIPNYEGKEVIIEFKYDRALPSGKNAPQPQKAGKHFNDMSVDFQIILSENQHF